MIRTKRRKHTSGLDNRKVFDFFEGIKEKGVYDAILERNRIILMPCEAVKCSVIKQEVWHGKDNK